MLTKADDYPIHQTPEPIAYSGTDRNFYDRYFFNGYQREGELFFAAALGVYPHLNVMDAAFSILVGGRQHNVQASKVLHMERLNTQVGPIEVEVIEPLNVLRVSCADPANGVAADVCFRARVPAVEEPRFTRRQGSLTFMDYTRLTQNGSYEGWLEVDGQRYELTHDETWGTRDRSWGIRSVGARDPQPNPYAGEPQFYWLWAPLNFPSTNNYYHLNADREGRPWNTMGRLADPERSEEMAAVASSIRHRSGTRLAASATLEYVRENGEEVTIELQPRQTFYMRGLGYMHPEWGHGLLHGELATNYEVYETAEIADADPGYFHVQAICDAQLTDARSSERGKGVLEQLVIGAYEPYGFRELFDVAP